MKTKEIKIGEVVTVANQEFIVLDKTDSSVLCLKKDFAYKDTKFDSDTNNYAESEIRKKLNGEYLQTISNEIGINAILDTEIDLTTDDGLDDYGKVIDKVGLLTAEMYRKYSRIIEKYPVNDWWWLSTATSTPHRGYRFSVRCVYGDNTLINSNCSNDYGVRPFCRFSSLIFKS